MSRTRISRWLVIAGTGALVVGGLAFVAPGAASTRAPSVASAQGRSIETLPECPHDWELLPKRLGGRVSLVDGFALVGEITNVPEFHDCQKLIVVNGKARRYGPLVAVFAAYDLNILEQRLDSLNGPISARRLPPRPSGSLTPTGATRTSIAPPAPGSGAVAGAPGPSFTATLGGGQDRDSALAGALILNTSLESYDPLSIRPGFSCLYLWRGSEDRAWKAKLVFVDTAQGRCARPIDVAAMRGVELAVKRDTIPGFADLSEDHYPAVARWDWDSTRSQHYIGIKCGRGWCEVGQQNLVSSALHMPKTIPATHTARVQRIRGWYDEQLLSEPDMEGTFGPGYVKGTIFPHPELQRQTWTDTANQWMDVAYVALSRPSYYYKKMLNLDAVSADKPLGSMNVFSMCYGTRDRCISDRNSPAAIGLVCGKSGPQGQMLWWMRIKSAERGDVMYRCVTRRFHDHLLKQIPGVVRWRWLAEDETTWVECDQGCCQTEVRS